MIEANLSAEETALKEIEEELRISHGDVKLIKQGPELRVSTPDSEVTVVPFLFEARTRAIRLNWEHTDFVWIRPDEVSGYQTVPRFDDLLRNLTLI